MKKKTECHQVNRSKTMKSGIFHTSNRTYINTIAQIEFQPFRLKYVLEKQVRVP